MRSYILMLGLLLLAGLVYPLPFGTDTQNDSQIWVRQFDNQVNVSLLVFDSSQAAVDAKKQFNDINTRCQQNSPSDIRGCMLNRSRELSQQASYNFSFYSVKDANFTFEYWNPYKPGGAGWAFVPECAQIPANVQDPDANLTLYNRTTGIFDPVPVYIAGCTVKKDIYAGRTTTVRISIAQTDLITAPRESITLSDANASVASNFSSALYNMIIGMSTPGSQGTLPCLGVFLVLGLLLASMYFSGRSPVTLLDITTPRLPSPKGFVAGGQIITPFGYTEMKRVTRRKMDAAVDLAKKILPTVALSSSDRNAISKIKDDAEKTAAALHLKAGGKKSDVKVLEKPWEDRTADEHGRVRQIYNGLGRAGGNSALFAKVADEYYLSKNLMQSLDTLTFKGGKGYAGQAATKMQTAFRKALSIDRYAAAGFVPVALDSTFRSIKLLGRSTKSAAVMGAQFARESGKWAVETVGGKMAMKEMEEKAKRSAGYSWLYQQLVQKPKEIKIGNMKQIDQNMAHLYNTLSGDLERDQVRYLLKQIYKQMGVNVAKMTDKEIFEMSHAIVDPLKKCVSPTANLAREAEVIAILSDSRLSMMEKRDKLESLLRSIGGHVDANYMRVKEEMDKIARDKVEGHVKMITLQETLDRENARLQAAKEGEQRLDDSYYSLVARRGALHGSDLWEMAVLRRMIYDCENGHTTKDVSIRDFLNAARLDLENKILTLNPQSRPELLPEFMRDKGVLSKKAEDNRKMFAGLLTDEGERVLKELTGKTRNNASLNDFMKVLYGNPYLLHSQGFKADEASGVHINPKTGKTLWWEEDQAIGPQKGWWKVDMKRHWIQEIDTRDLGQAGTWVEAKSTRSFVSMEASKPSISAKLDRYSDSKTWTPEKRQFEFKKAWVKEEIEANLHNNFNGMFAMNAYGGTTNEVMRYYGSATASLLAKALRDAGYEEHHTDLRFLESMDVNKAKDMERLKYMIGERYKKEFSEVLKKGITYDDIAKSKQVWIMTHEGAYLPYRSGMPVSDNDRVINGHVAIRDDKGAWRRYDPDNTNIDFGGRHDLATQFGKLGGNSNKAEWEAFLKSTVAWAKDGGHNYDREKVLGAVLWRYGTTTTDYMKFWKESGVKLVSRNEAIPLAPSVLRYFGVEAPGLSKALKPFRDFGQIAGHYMVRTALDGAGEWQMRSYDVTPKSQMLKMQSWRNATQIMTTDWKEALKDVTSEYDRRQLASAYMSVALAHGAYHQVWAFSIDRNPWRSSTSHGLHQAASAAFPLGPSETYSMKANLRAYMDKYEYGSFMAAYGWPAMMARKAIMPYQKMVAGAQRSLQGYMSKWDTTDDPLKPFGQHTAPRLMESLRMYNPMSFSWGRGWASQKIDALNKFQSRAEKAQLTGWDHQKGLKQSYSDIQVVYKGAAAIARTSMANPGASYIDTRFNEQLAPAMAEYAMMRMDNMRGYFANDAYVRGQALTDTIHRTVSAEALAIKRQQELMGFGVLQNPLYTWFNPVFFAYHMGVPGYPESMSPKELLSSFVNKYKKGGGGGNIVESFKDSMNRTGQAMGRAFTPWKASMVKYCRCGTPGYSPGTCKNPRCGARL